MGRKGDFVVTYTNKDIMDKLESIDSKIEESKSISKRAMITASTALTLTIIALGYLVSHLISSLK